MGFATVPQKRAGHCHTIAGHCLYCDSGFLLLLPLPAMTKTPDKKPHH